MIRTRTRTRICYKQQKLNIIRAVNINININMSSCTAFVPQCRLRLEFVKRIRPILESYFDEVTISNKTSVNDTENTIFFRFLPCNNLKFSLQAFHYFMHKRWMLKYRDILVQKTWDSEFKIHDEIRVSATIVNKLCNGLFVSDLAYITGVTIFSDVEMFRVYNRVGLSMDGKPEINPLNVTLTTREERFINITTRWNLNLICYCFPTIVLWIMCQLFIWIYVHVYLISVTMICMQFVSEDNPSVSVKRLCYNSFVVLLLVGIRYYNMRKYIVYTSNWWMLFIRVFVSLSPLSLCLSFVDVVIYNLNLNFDFF